MIKKEGKGFLVVFNGIIGSGKTTLSTMAFDFLKEKGLKTIRLLDSTKDFWGHDTDYSIDGRFDALKRTAYGAHLLTESGISVLLCVIIPKEAFRKVLQSKMDFYEIFLDADLDDCITHDSKGIYKEYLKKKNPQLVGFDQVFEKPNSPDLVLHPYKESVAESVAKVRTFLTDVVLKEHHLTAVP